MGEENEYDWFEPVTITMDDFPAEGYILDIGGGGEGVIGRLKGRDVIAIDLRRDELEEAAEGPLKIVMDARELKFLDDSFQTATAFFSFMYLKTRMDHLQVFQEICRVLKPGGIFHLWEADVSTRPETGKEYYIVQVRYRIGENEFGTGYGQRWPDDTRNEAYYISLAEEAGLQCISTRRNQNTFYLVFQKMIQ